MVQEIGGAEALCALLRGGYAEEKKAATAVLARLAVSEESRSVIATRGNIDALVHLLR